MAAGMIKGQEVRVGDDLWSGGTPHRVTRIEPYMHPVVTRNEPWRIAYSDGPVTGGAKAWGMTLEYDGGWAASYEVTVGPEGDPRTVPHLTADDHLSPWYGVGCRLHKLYAAEGSPGTWRDWLAARDAKEVRP